MSRIDLHVAADHPAYAGHFPQQPLLPGVILLDLAQRAIETHNAVTLNGLAVAKFHSPALPGDALTLDYTLTERTAAFEINSGERKIASGQFTVKAASASA